MPATLLLTRRELRRAVDVPPLTEEVRCAMADTEGDGRAQRLRSRVNDAVTATVPVPGLAPVYGLPLQDCVAAWHAYRAALERGLGTPLHLES